MKDAHSSIGTPDRKARKSKGILEQLISTLVKEHDEGISEVMGTLCKWSSERRGRFASVIVSNNPGAWSLRSSRRRWGVLCTGSNIRSHIHLKFSVMEEETGQWTTILSLSTRLPKIFVNHILSLGHRGDVKTALSIPIERGALALRVENLRTV